ACRQMHEQSGLRVLDAKLAGQVVCAVYGDSQPVVTHVFCSTTYDGPLQESPDVQPPWYTHETLPYNEMWQDAAHWLHHVLAGRFFRGLFLYSGQNLLFSHVHVLGSPPPSSPSLACLDQLLESTTLPTFIKPDLLAYRAARQ